MSHADDKPLLRPSERVARIADSLGHQFADYELLELATTHASCLDAQASRDERTRTSNERLEFLGDTLLDAAVGEMLFDHFPASDEGDLSRYKSRLVSREMLARAAEDHALLPVCRVGDKMQGTWPDSVKANFVESILAAIYRDGGWAPLQEAVKRLIGPHLDDVEALCRRSDAKGLLQDWALREFQQLPEYQTRRDGGSDHAPEFTCRAVVGDQAAEGHGTSRRRAEIDAALALLDRARADQSAIDPS